MYKEIFSALYILALPSPKESKFLCSVMEEGERGRKGFVMKLGFCLFKLLHTCTLPRPEKNVLAIPLVAVGWLWQKWPTTAMRQGHMPSEAAS